MIAFLFPIVKVGIEIFLKFFPVCISPLSQAKTNPQTLSACGMLLMYSRLAPLLYRC